MTYDQARRYKMPCGKYEGRSLDHLPMEELIWVADNWEVVTEFDNELVAAACVVWEYLDARWEKEHPDLKTKKTTKQLLAIANIVSLCPR